MKMPEKVQQFIMTLFLQIRDCIGMSTLVNSQIATTSHKNERIFKLKAFCGKAEFKKINLF